MNKNFIIDTRHDERNSAVLGHIIVPDFLLWTNTLPELLDVVDHLEFEPTVSSLVTGIDVSRANIDDVLDTFSLTEKLWFEHRPKLAFEESSRHLRPLIHR